MTSTDKPAHTPGPWSLNEERQIVGADGQRVGELHGNPRDVFAEAARVEADRRLMAAAPDLLVALQEALLCMEAVNRNSPCWARATIGDARAAIARATGG